MNREQLEHVIGSAATIADDDEIVVIGSQAILGQFPDAPLDLCRSMEADVWPLHHPERAELIEGSIGELSMFHETFGYYAQGVGPKTAVLPDGWLDRVVRVRSPRTRGATGLCLELHDLVIAKLVAGREKDTAFIRGTIAHQLIDEPTVLARLEATPLEDDRRRSLADLVRRWFRQRLKPAPGPTKS